MHKGMALIRQRGTARGPLCMFGSGKVHSRDGVVLSPQTSFKTEFSLWICDKKLSFRPPRLDRRRIALECQDRITKTL
jgi:hypothetical protein